MDIIPDPWLDNAKKFSDKYVKTVKDGIKFVTGTDLSNKPDPSKIKFKPGTNAIDRIKFKPGVNGGNKPTFKPGVPNIRFKPGVTPPPTSFATKVAPVAAGATAAAAGGLPWYAQLARFLGGSKSGLLFLGGDGVQGPGAWRRLGYPSEKAYIDAVEANGGFPESRAKITIPFPGSGQTAQQPVVKNMAPPKFPKLDPKIDPRTGKPWADSAEEGAPRQAPTTTIVSGASGPNVDGLPDTFEGGGEVGEYLPAPETTETGLLTAREVVAGLGNNYEGMTSQGLADALAGAQLSIIKRRMADGETFSSNVASPSVRAEAEDTGRSVLDTIRIKAGTSDTTIDGNNVYRTPEQSYDTPTTTGTTAGADVVDTTTVQQMVPGQYSKLPDSSFDGIKLTTDRSQQPGFQASALEWKKYFDSLDGGKLTDQNPYFQ